MIAAPLSRQEIRVLANIIRKIAGYDTNFNILEFLEKTISEKLDSEFEMHVVEDEEIKGCYAKACPEKHLIIVSETAYNGAYKGIGRHRFTLCHELGHYLLHEADRVSFPRLDRNIKPYEDTEWQANTFAGELLVPEDIAKNFSADEIVKICGVSRQVALIQKEQVSKQKNRATKRLESLVTIA
jgi:hypothetical protein